MVTLRSITEQWRGIGSIPGVGESSSVWAKSFDCGRNVRIPLICIAVFKELSKCKAVCDVNQVLNLVPFIAQFWVKVWPLFPSLKANKKVKFQLKGSKNNTMYLGRFRRINKVRKCVEVIGNLKLSLLIHLYLDHLPILYSEITSKYFNRKRFQWCFCCCNFITNYILHSSSLNRCQLTFSSLSSKSTSM